MRNLVRSLILTTLGLLVSFGPGVAFAANYKLNVADQTLAEGYRAIIDEAFTKLPASFQADLPLNLEFNLMDGKGRPAEMSRNKVYLRSSLLTKYLEDSSDASYHREIAFARHPDFHTFMVAMMVHELSHMIDQRYDFSQRLDFDLLQARHAYALDRSSDGETRAPMRTRGNFFEGRSVDPYEFTNQREAFAVGFEFFVLDPEYKCRRPRDYEFYRKNLRFSPSLSNCGSFMKNYYINPSLTSDEAFKPTIVSPRGKLYAIHYLIAGKGKAAMSRFGHSMLRLVYCDPDRTVATEQCLYDVDQHVVITPAAAITDLEISQLDGLTGKYLSSFYAALLGSTTQLYNRIEEREILSIPLTLTPAQLASVEQAIHESHWTYRNKYYFTVNNCATEIINVLKRAMPENENLQSSYSATPFSLLTTMIQLGLTADVPVEHWRADKTKRFYFPPATAALNQLAKFAADNMANPEVLNYMKMNGADRLRIAKLSLDSAEAKRVGRALGALESNLLLKLQLDVFKAIVRDASLRATLKTANDTIQKQYQSWFSPPTVLTKDHYGVPSDDEISEILNARANDIDSFNKDRTSMFSAVKLTAEQTAQQKQVLESEAILAALEGPKKD